MDWSLLILLLCNYCTVLTPTEATTHTVFRAARYDTGGVVLYDLWSGNDTFPAIDQPISWQYFNTSEVHKQVLKSAILECAWDKVQEVEFAFYDADQRVMFHTFNISGSGAGKMDWFSRTYLTDSTYYADIASTSSFLYFSITGFVRDPDYRRRFYIEIEHGYCHITQKGWSMVNDVGSGSTAWDPTCACQISPDGQFPTFMYSPISNSSTCTYYIQAETMLVKVTLEDNAFGGSCVSSCVDVADGWYQSCIGCNVYVKCQSEVLTHHSCSDGHEFDDLHKACVSPQSTTCVGGNVNGSCLPPLGDIPAYVINTTEEATTEGDTTTTEDTTTANLVGTNTRTNQCSGYGNICRFSARRVEVDAYNMAARTSLFVTNSPIQCTQRCARIPDCEFFNYRNQPNGGSEKNCHAHALTTGQVIPNPPGNLTGWNVYELF